MYLHPVYCKKLYHQENDVREFNNILQIYVSNVPPVYNVTSDKVDALTTQCGLHSVI